jgi:ubiquitin carboxyl-terminal hydrolase 1
MITRPPAILRCHLVRSEYTNWGTMVKKTARIAFPAVLDFTQHNAWNVWDENEPCGYMLEPQDLAEVVKNINKRKKLLYRLESVICHYGYTHSFGHFVAYRRKPVVEGDLARPRKGVKSCSDGCICNQCIFGGQVRSSNDWLRISDADVEVVNEADVLAEMGNVFMVFYQRVDEGEALSHESQDKIESSEETAEMTVVEKTALASEVGSPVVDDDM